jgi:hypothetical protein
MLVVYGNYYLSQRCVAFRNDYCRQCKAERLSLQFRAFEIGHIFWIPLLPKGFLRRWVCTTCSRDPHFVVTSNGVKWAGILFLALLALSVWTTSPKPGEVVVYWVARVGLLWGIYALWRAIQSSRRVADQVAAVSPYAGAICPSCRGPLASVSGTRTCTRCGARQLDLSAHAA